MTMTMMMTMLSLPIEINSCYNNSRCGRHGQCQNLIVKYRCICNFMYTGEYCHQCKLTLNTLIVMLKSIECRQTRKQFDSIKQKERSRRRITSSSIIETE